jgi:hypothetical protein
MRLSLAVEGVEVETLQRPAAASVVRRTALVRLRGAGREGRGEEVTFQDGDRLAAPPEDVRVPETRSAVSRCGFVLVDEAAEHVSAVNTVDNDNGV